MAALSGRGLRAAGAEESYSEGIIDQLRALRARRSRSSCASHAAGERAGPRKVSLRATDDDVDVSVIARAQGGGGHRRAAGFTTTLEPEELIAFLRASVAAQLHALPDERPLRSPERPRRDRPWTASC